MHWYWSVVAFLMAIGMVCAVGVLARNYIGKRMIEWADTALLHVPFLNKIYSATNKSTKPSLPETRTPSKPLC